MYRKITEKLEIWKESANRKPLIVRGPRQVGKTYSIKDFGEKKYKNCHIIDLERNPELKGVFEKDKDPKRIISELEIFLRKKIEINTDLLFIDEIQNSPDALSALRYFYEEIPELHLIAAGSLIEFALQNISFPAGRVDLIYMYPMNFEEFLIASKNHLLIKNLQIPNSKIPDIVHNTLLQELRKYFFVGGMPEAVKIYLHTNSFIEVQAVHSQLLESFRQDFSKYAGKADKNCLDKVLLATAKNVGKQTKYTSLAENFSIPTIKNAYHLLLRAKVINRISNADPSGLPLGGNITSKNFKTIFVDIGLMNRASDLTLTNELMEKDLLNIYNGALAEQFVGQEFLAAGMNELYFWARTAKSSTAEVDYLYTKENEIFPVEVKSGPAGKLRSLHILLTKYKNIREAHILSTANYSELPEQKLKFIPIYTAGNLF